MRICNRRNYCNTRRIWLPKWVVTVILLVMILIFIVTRNKAEVQRYEEDESSLSGVAGDGETGLLTSRHAVDGWVGVRHPFFWYCYSAYLDDRDDRPAFDHKHAHNVVIVALVKNMHLMPRNLTCSLHYGASSDNGGQQTEGQPLGIIAKWENLHGRGKGCWTVVCTVARSQVPDYVTLTYVPTETELCRLPVRRPPKPAVRQELGVCVAPVYLVKTCAECKPQNIAQNIVPWLEMQKVMGVNAVTIYNHSMEADVSKILQYYINSGFVTVHPYRPVLGYHHRLPNQVAINDCMYRNMYTFKKIMIIDLDEYIVTEDVTTSLPLFLRSLAKRHRYPYEGTSFTFQNTLHYTDAPVYDRTIPSNFPMFRYVYRTEPEPYPGGCKTIVDPLYCSHMTMHLCVYNKGGRRIHVNTNNAKLHHFKTCKDSWWNPINSTCASLFKTMTEDTNMLRYKDYVVERVGEMKQIIDNS